MDTICYILGYFGAFVFGMVTAVVLVFVFAIRSSKKRKPNEASDCIHYRKEA